MSYSTFRSLLFLLLFVGFWSCEKENFDIGHPEDLITTLIYILTPEDGGNDVVLSFRDLDGDGGDAPIIKTVGTIKSSTVYKGTLELLNESISPIENITEEIREKAETHQFFFQTSSFGVSTQIPPTSINGIALGYYDVDTDGNPIGLITRLSASGEGSAEIIITLRHEPSKDAEDVSTGDITNAGGETNIEVTFMVGFK